MSAVVALKTIFSPNMFSHAVIKENGRVSSRARGLITTHFVSNNKKQALYFHISDSILWLRSIIDTTTTEQWVQTLLDLNSGYTQKLKLVTGYGFAPTDSVSIFKICTSETCIPPNIRIRGPFKHPCGVHQRSKAGLRSYGSQLLSPKSPLLIVLLFGMQNITNIQWGAF